MAADLHIELERHIGALRVLARQLVGAQRAEDLLQDVALQALEAKAPAVNGWRGWMQVVLRRRASNQLRDDRRRRAREAAVVATATPLAAAAADLASQRELVRRVTDELLSLPEPYRETLFRRFFQDLTPTAIAAATGAPLATVKSRLQRGLEMLRERLGREQGGDWRACLAAAFGLGNGGAPAGAFAIGGLGTSGTLGALAMTWKTAMAVAGALLVLLTLGYVWWAPATLAPGTQGTAADPAAAPARDPAALAVEPAARVEVDVARPTAAAAVAERRAGRVRGRVIGSDTRAPLGGAAIQLAIDGESATGTAAADGTFELAVDATRLCGNNGPLRVQPPVGSRYVSRCVLLTAATPDADGRLGIDCGDIAMVVGTHVTAVEVDGYDRPAQLALKAMAGVELIYRLGTQQEDGSRHDFGLLGPGTYRLALVDDARRTVDPESITISAGKTELEIPFRIDIAEVADGSDSISGKVVDQGGRGIGGIQVRAWGERIESAQTHADGRFTVYASRGTRRSACLSIDTRTLTIPGGSAMPYPNWNGGPFAWGTKDILIQLVEHPSIRVRVRSPTGPAQGKCRIYVQYPALAFVKMCDVQLDRDGVATLAQMPVGHAIFTAWVSDTGSDSVPIAVDDLHAGSMVDLLVQPRQPCNVTVRAGGIALPDTTVDVMEEEEGLAGRSNFRPVHRDDPLAIQYSIGRCSATAVSDARGEARLTVRSGVDHIVCCVCRTDEVIGVFRVPLTQHGDELRGIIDMPGLGRIVGSVTGGGGSHFALRLERKEWVDHLPDAWPTRGQAMSIGHEGAFDLQDIPPGLYRAFLMAEDNGRWSGQPPCLGIVEIVAGGTTRLDIDATPKAPASCTLTFPDPCWDGTSVSLVSLDWRMYVLQQKAVVRDGRAEFTGLSVGRWLITLQREGRWIAEVGDVELKAGEDRTVALPLGLAHGVVLRLEPQVPRSDWKDLWLVMRTPAGNNTRLNPDDDGCVAIGDCPAGDFTFELFERAGIRNEGRSLGRAQVRTAAGPPAVVEVPLR